MMNTEKFDLVVKFNSSNQCNEGSICDTYEQIDEIEGIDEIESALTRKDPELYIKESESIDVVLVELGTDSQEAAKLLRNSNPRIVSTVIPIRRVVKTDLREIGRNLKELAIKEMEPGDNFTVETSVISHKTIESADILEKVEDELKVINMNFDETDPKWKIYVEVIGESTGLNILKSKESILCMSN
ncbi:MAG: THUMP domain-containing protein [Methanobacterium sp. ERen5]|nr:MAG: THUMP domain-containing protein [Methanobacterium sp. ERen5]